jgi:hypothetical protein
MSQPIQETIKQYQTIGDTPDNWQQTVTFCQFDPSLGALTAVDVGLAADVIGNVSVVDLGPLPATVTARLSSDLSVQSPGGYVLGAVAALASNLGSVVANDGSISLALAGTGTSDSGPLSGVDLGNFVGTGAVPLAVADVTRLHVTGPANMLVSTGASSGAVASLQYGYVPPSSGGGYGDSGSVSTILQYVGIGFLPLGAVATATQTFRFGDQTTGWNSSAAVAQFKPELGTLVAVNVTLTSDIAATANLTNGATSASAISTTQTAVVSFGSLLSVAPQVSANLQLVEAASSFAPGLTAVASNFGEITDPNVLSSFTGRGTVEVPITTTGTATVDGPGDMSAMLSAQDGAVVTVSYSYLPPCIAPDPLVWEAPTDGQWDLGFHWGHAFTEPANLLDAFPPQATDDVAITTPGTYTITLGTAQTIHSLVIDAPDATLVLDANLTVAGDFILDAGTIEFNGSTLSAGNITMNGGEMIGNEIDLAATGSLAINSGSVNSPGAVTLQAESLNIGTVQLGNIGTLQLGSVLDIQIPVVSATGIVIDGTSFPGNIAGVQCFARGTRIASPRGALPVETLSVGDTVRLASGDTAAITWIGYREVVCRRHPQPCNVWPVRISRGAFGDAAPQRDLLLSPDHAVFADGVLIPVKYLVNGRSIRQVRRARIDYFHIELPRHDILLAEGLTVESYLDTGSRRNFATDGMPPMLHPDFSSLAWEAGGCAPLIVTGPRLDAVRQRLEATTSAEWEAGVGRRHRRAA